MRPDTLLRCGRRVFLAAAAALLAGGMLAPAAAERLRIGMTSAPTSIDPHFHASGSNISLLSQVFDGLTSKDARLQPGPGLAERWEYVEPTRVRFHLRKGVTFHDGAPFTAHDVAFTYARVPTVVDSPSPFTSRLRGIERVEVVDDHTLDILTSEPAPNLTVNLAEVFIISRKVGEGKTTADYVTGSAMIGTGPYRFVSARIGEVYELERYDDYWGGAAPWDAVTVRIIGSAPARIAALLSGEVDVIDQVPATDQAQLEANPAISLWQVATNRVVFVALDVGNDVPIPGQASANDGSALERNPMKDVLVRRALSMALDRPGLVERGLSGDAFAASQLVPEGLFGFDPGIPVEPFDPQGARALLAEAGYPDGFRLVLTTSNNDDQRVRAAQAVAQMWARVGVRTELDTMPHSVFIPNTNDYKYGHMIHSWGTSTGEAAYTLNGIAGTRDLQGGRGTSNRGRYSNERVDALVTQASGTIDDNKRAGLLREAMRIVISEDYGILPLYSPRATWASRAGVNYTPSMDIRTNALYAAPGTN